MVTAVGARRAALPGAQGRFPRVPMGPRAKPEDDSGGEAGVRRRSRDGVGDAQLPLPPPLRGRGQRPGISPAEGEVAAGGLQANAHLDEQILAASRRTAAPHLDPLPPRATRTGGQGGRGLLENFRRAVEGLLAVGGGVQRRLETTCEAAAHRRGPALRAAAGQDRGDGGPRLGRREG